MDEQPVDIECAVRLFRSYALGRYSRDAAARLIPAAQVSILANEDARLFRAELLRFVEPAG